MNDAPILQDEASTSIAMALLYHGGFHALQLQRVAHYMWESGNITSALRIQVLLCGDTLAGQTGQYCFHWLPLLDVYANVLGPEYHMTILYNPADGCQIFWQAVSMDWIDCHDSQM